MVVSTHNPCVCLRNTCTIMLGKMISSILIFVPQMEHPTVTLGVSVWVSLSHSLSVWHSRSHSLSLSHSPLFLCFSLTLHVAFLQLNSPFNSQYDKFLFTRWILYSITHFHLLFTRNSPRWSGMCHTLLRTNERPHHKNTLCFQTRTRYGLAK